MRAMCVCEREILMQHKRTDSRAQLGKDKDAFDQFKSKSFPSFMKYYNLAFGILQKIFEYVGS